MARIFHHGLKALTAVPVLLLPLFCLNPAVWGSQEANMVPARTVSERTMQDIYEQIRTPYKYGIVLKHPRGQSVDCPTLFRKQGRWFMLYIIFDHRTGYETWLASSDDLLRWKTEGCVLPYRSGTWDQCQAAGFVALQDISWSGTHELEPFAGKYWFSYVGGALEGYETDPLSVGMAWTRDPARPEPFQRLPEPVLAPGQGDARAFEKVTLYRSNVIRDPDERLGAPFVMFYNGKDIESTERIGMAVSHDMITWKRYGKDPVIDHKTGISGDPQLMRLGEVWVMVYFGAFWKPKAFDTFACSYDLEHWTDWNGPHLVEPSEPWDETYAHKPWVLKHEDIVYHFYCAVGTEGRVIALATSKPIPRKQD